ncbi:DUF4352 domain-containing protein [Nocardiopsis suaedae]|uniref:DUF4352 domain-containing protein n=1 Tax=Nocardiopsis suaedae TaxID=3018444 RepID=A0ABT4TKL9_9ACTN|nr:DUF4352 domain-containing protein [Nocardiopsis suaedae]MDA2805215.1 DUF4352 domain-containing protein [Nocardiopsis suaedae]
MSTGAKIGLGCGLAAALGFLLLIGGCVALIVSSPPSDDGGSADPSADGGGSEGEGGSGDGGSGGQDAAAIGETVESGAFAFTVTGVETGVTEVSDESGFVTETPDGQYVVVDVTVENIGEESGYFDSSSQKLIDADGKEYSTDTVAEITGDTESLLNEINPGNTVEGQLIFDVPEDVELDRLELRDFISLDSSAVVDVSGA